MKQIRINVHDLLNCNNYIEIDRDVKNKMISIATAVFSFVNQTRV